ncbi:ferrous iron transport protein A [Deltaproteobacteria bacterium]|nr:ferrous iron transport protein A [Deltaproteobacteria bacterium]
MNQETNLAGMEKGHTGIVSTILGGRRFRMKLESLGIRPGSKVTKISNLFTRGPIVLYVGGTEVAIGYKMAMKIIINVPIAEKST